MRTYVSSMLLASCLLSMPMIADEGGSAAGSLQTYEGIVHAVWSDGPRQGTVRVSLTQDDGTTFELRLGDNVNEVLSHFGKRVLVSGRAVPGPTRESVLTADRVQPAPQSFSRIGATAVLGTRRMLYLLLRFPDDSAVPHPPQYYLDMTNPDVPPAGAQFPATINGFFKKTSWNQFQWIADVGGIGGVPASGWFTLPHARSHYVDCGTGSCAEVRKIENDAMALAVGAGIDVTQYDNINFVVSNDLDCCAYGGGMVYNGKFYGATWMPAGSQETGTYVHELGHSLGLPHSGWVYYAYDSPWDVMSGSASAGAFECGSYYSQNHGRYLSTYCTEPGGGFIAAHKDYLGWIPASHQVVTDSSSSISVTLDALSLALGSAPKMLKICINGSPCEGPSAHYLTVEARSNTFGNASRYDNGLPSSGIIIHDVLRNRPYIGEGDPCFFNSTSGWAVPRDATPGDWIGKPVCIGVGSDWKHQALGNAEWLPGQTYVDPSGVAIRIGNRVGSTFVVEQIGAPACVANATTACMLNGRFRATVRYRAAFDNAPVDTNAFLKPVSQFSNPNFETAFFYFNSSENIEILLKILDQGNRDSQNRPTIAVLFGSATPLRTELTVVDTKTGAVRIYTNSFSSQQGMTDFIAFVK